MATDVRATGAHYALKLKSDHAPLFTCVETAFATADRDGTLEFYEESESGHDRQERRRASVIARSADAPVFPHLSAVGPVELERQANGKSSATVHNVVLSPNA
jgi:hypothetical protein